MRAFVDLWDEITRVRYGVEEPKYRRFRYGVQVNSLGLTEQQPENNVYRILIEMLAVTLSRRRPVPGRCSFLLGTKPSDLPRPWDQQWSLRMQQILAFETDLLEYEDIFDGNPAIEAKVEALKAGRPRRAGADRRHGRGDGGHRLHEGAARRVECRADRPDRGGRHHGRRRQQMDRTRPLAAHLRPRGDHGRPIQRPRLTRWRGSSAWRSSRDEERGANRVGRARPRRCLVARMSCPPRLRPQRPARPRANGATPCAPPSANTAGPRGCRRSPSNRTEGLDGIRARVDAVSQTRSGAGSNSSSANRGSTAIPTAPNKSPRGRAIAEWTSPMKASA